MKRRRGGLGGRERCGVVRCSVYVSVTCEMMLSRVSMTDNVPRGDRDVIGEQKERWSPLESAVEAVL